MNWDHWTLIPYRSESRIAFLMSEGKNEEQACEIATREGLVAAIEEAQRFRAVGALSTILSNIVQALE